MGQPCVDSKELVVCTMCTKTCVGIVCEEQSYPFGSERQANIVPGFNIVIAFVEVG